MDLPHQPGLLFPGPATKRSIVLDGERGSFSRGRDKDCSCAPVTPVSSTTPTNRQKSSLKYTLDGKDATTKSLRASAHPAPRMDPWSPLPAAGPPVPRGPSGCPPWSPFLAQAVPLAAGF